MKNAYLNSFWVPITLLLIVSLWVVVNQPVKIISAQAQNARVDISKLNNKCVLKLDGQWRYYPATRIRDLQLNNTKQFVQVPHLFNGTKDFGYSPYGVATYKMVLTGLIPEEIYSIQIVNEASAYRLTVNGNQIMHAGTVYYSQDGHVPEMREMVGTFESDREGKAEILIEVSNYSYNYGGLWKTPVFGTNAVLSRYVSHQDGVEVYLFSSILVLGLFLLGLFSIHKKFQPLFYFALICITIAGRVMLTNNKQFYTLIYDVSWDLGTRLEFLSAYLLLPLFGLFFYSLEYTKKNKFVKWTCELLVALAIIIVFCTPNSVYANLIPTYLNMFFASLIYFGYVLYRGISAKKNGAGMILIGSLGFIPTALVDFYGASNYMLVPMGTLFMLICFCSVVIKSFLSVMIKHEYLAEAIIVDPLTGLRNRYFLNSLMNTGINVSQNKKMYILFMDLDKFKQINDTHGHNFGDQILIESARRLNKCFSKDTDIVCRYGGDEFIVFVEVKEGAESVEDLIARVKLAFKEKFAINEKVFTVSLSIGFVEYDPSGSLEKAIKASDDAMYQAKKSNVSLT